MDDAQLQRYARHLLLDGIGFEGQERLLGAHALVVGAGGLGCPAAMYLASAGVGRITLVDGDLVDATNLQRQIGHTYARIGMPKVQSLAQTLRDLNRGIDVRTVQAMADGAWLDANLAGVDVVLDCTDRFATRHAVNRACVAHRVALVVGAAVRYDGQVTVVDPRSPGTACYACTFPYSAQAVDADCATLGVLAPLVGIIGATQAVQALLLLTESGEPLAGRLLMVDARSMQWDTLRTVRDPHCAVCGGSVR